MVRWTSACCLLLGACVTSLALVPRVTVAHSLKQKSTDEDLVFEDDDYTAAAGPAADGGPLTVAVIGGHDEGLQEARRRPRRQAASASFFSDDEDALDGSGAGSGDGSGRYRIELEVDGYYQPSYSSSSSTDFFNEVVRVREALEPELSKLPGTIDARLTRIQPGGTNRLKLLVDVAVVDSDVDEFQIRSIFDKFEGTGRMGDFTNVKLLRFSQEEDPHAGKCGVGQVLCPSGACAVLCNGVRECPLGEDERDCLDTPVEVDVTELTTSAPPPPVLTTTTTTTTSSPLEKVDVCPGDNKFPCPAGRLIICREQVCDGPVDCDDGSDEANCGCPEFTCGDGRCIENRLRCDGTFNCLDRSDELNCPPLGPACSTLDEFLCDNDILCLPLAKRCDGVQDCADATDEADCECSVDEFKCADDGTCIPSFYKCDGVADCKDGSDEAPSVCDGCRADEFTCTADDRCLPGRLKCDGNSDCSDGSDEKLRECCVSGFWCDDTCRDASVRCNQVPDCRDGSDEVGCVTLPIACDVDEFQCDDGSCIENFQRCDRVLDCPNGEDERNCRCQPPNFQCISGMCIGSEKLCNGIDDCDDGSDEFSCPSRVCRDGDFRCDDGSCIDMAGRCDGSLDCTDASDELECECRPDQWQCFDQSCVVSSQRCDGTPDCPDGSDERGCTEASATPSPQPSPPSGAGGAPTIPSSGGAPAPADCPAPDYFRCGTGLCIPARQKCDGTTNCQDYSDEQDCDFTCSSSEYSCEIEKKCIPYTDVCNGRADCAGGSDESDCGTVPCRSDQFRCNDGGCLALSQRCNNVFDCRDGEDERNCPAAPSSCSPYEFQCADGTCIENDRRCDQFDDCPDASDEAACPPPQCPYDTFTCNNGQCVDLSQRCDGTSQCSDASDEVGCPPVNRTCSATEFRCDDGECIDVQWKCDDVVDCYDGSDEDYCRCGSGQFECGNRQCVQETQRCDGVSDCQDGSDERDCATPSLCNSVEWECDTGECVYLTQKCNGFSDCPDGSDEWGCPVSSQPCPGGDSEYRCSTGECILRSEVCNNYDDCENGEDEQFCDALEPIDQPGLPTTALSPDSRGSGYCRSDEFQCANGECLPANVQCNGVFECIDGFDELSCPVVNCTADEFRCDTGECLDVSLRCDGRYDCLDASDELLCGLDSYCNDYEYQCNNGDCVSKRVVCDGRPDCFDRSDESYCGPVPPAPCGASEYRCSDGLCIPEFLRCDGRPHCADNSDEIDCPSYAACSSEEWSCDDGQCVSQRVRCDGQPDCFDQSDEQNCDSSALVTTTAAPPPPCAPFFEFTCRRSGRCIASSGVCDQRVDCDDGSDEENCPSDPFPAFPTPSPATTPPSPTTPQPYPTPTSRPYSPYPTPVPTSRPYPSYPTPTPTFRPYPPYPSPTPTSSPYPPYVTPPSAGAGGYPYDGDRFSCASGQTIPADQKCDGIVDCHDGTDESNCGSSGGSTPAEDAILLKTYPDQQTIKQSREVVFQCRDEGRLRSAVRWSRPDASLPRGYTDERGRLTIPNIQLEDAGVYYCEAVGVPANTPGFRKTVYLDVVPYTTSYTTAPPPACSVNQATCMNGECIPKSAVCDGDSDCSDASDEMRCNPLGCEPNEFQCDNKRCVLKTWLCDSDDDCGDGSDERSCGPPLPGALCNINEFRCNTLEQCIPKSFHCDGEVDCADMSDEVGCTKPTFVESPPRSYSVRVTETYTLTCRAVGVPVPTVIWRLNWGHVPEKCTMTSEDGYGVLTCPDARPTDQGAYSCEAINIKGSVFVVPDTILTVSGQESICVPPQFNAAAISPRDCLTCFCFGATTDCYSTDRYISQLPPPVSESFQIVGVNLDQVEGKYVIRDSEYPLQSRYVTTNFLGNAELKVPDRTRLGAPSDLLIYFSLPDSHKGARLLSYGGYLRYNVRFTGVGAGQALNGPDVIIRGNGVTLMHVHDGTLLPEQDNRVDVRFWPGQWYKSVVQLGNRLQTQDPAAREDIMMVLENMDLLLIRALYYDSLVVRATLSDVQLDTAVITSTNQGRAVFVEECRCPQGYTGLSCEQCAPNYRRSSSGQWLGRCVPDVQCRAGEYGDPANNIPCLPCPCPLTNYPNQFGQSCYLDTDGQVTCNCPSGYSGRRCETCSPGYRGDPTVPGDSCQPGGCDPAGSTSSVADPFSRQCNCKQFTTGPTCSECQEGSFYLHEDNPYGCIQCFCMGTTRTCSSSNLYRTQITANPGRNSQGFALVDQDQTQTITDFPASLDGELVYNSFPNYGDVVPYYWRLPPQFLGNKVTAYGGELVYTLRHVPYPNGAISRNSAYDVEINGNSVTLRHYGSQQVTSSQSVTVRVPLVESEWRRQDDNPANREHMLMALANINYILIKATYTTATSEAALESVQMDIAETRNTGGPRAGAVEVCSCPEGYKGYSCEECSAGYTRGLSGLYLGVCVPCDCNGHSDECDPETNECTNCRDNTAGFYCDECLPGYYQDPATGRCERRDGAPDCTCDPRGVVSDQCVNGVCSCKANVMGDSCSLCAPGYFGLSAANPDGCRPCWCSGVTDQCFSSSFLKMEIPMNLIGENPGFVITNRARTDVKREGFRVNIRDNQITFSEMDLLNERDSYYWSLPQSFTGNLLASYGGKLEVTQLYDSSSPNLIREADVVIRGSNGLELVWMLPSPLPQGQPFSYTVPLVETGFVLNQYPVSRAEFLQVLSSVEVILIRATPSEGMISTTLSNVVLDTAVSYPTGLGRAESVEQCRCPNEYQGLSCESCMPGFYRDSRTNRCLQCNCNGHEDSCEEGPDGRPKCNCIPGYYGDYCEKSGYPEPPLEGETAGDLQRVTIDGPSIQVVAVGSTVTYYCRADIPRQDGRLYISWSRKDGELPYGRASDDRNGRLVITQVQRADSGQYVCTVSDGFNLVLQTEATLTVEDRRAPERPSVVIEEQEETVEVTVGQYYEVRCRADGYPTPRISWSRLDNLPLPPEASVQNGLLTFYQMTPASSGAYVCSGSNEGGQAQAIITIVVEGTVPELPYQPSTITVTVTQTEVEVSQGGTVRVDCSAPAQYAIAVLRWSRINGQLPLSATDYDGELVIPNAQPEDSGLYLCRVETSDGYSGEATTRVQILRTYNVPTVRIEPDRQTVNQGSSAEVRCIASGTPQPTISWSKVNSQFGRGVSVDGDVLRISAAEISDRGMYVCDASNSGGSARAVTVIEVERREPPSVKMYPEAQQSLQPGNTALFQCHLTGGIPMPEITWARADGRPMTPNTEIKPGGIITFNQVTGSEKGTYICTARNDAGEVRSTAVLDIVALPVISIQPSLNPYQVLEGSSVRLECSASGDPAPTVAWQLLRTNYPTQLPGRSLSPSTVEYELASVRPEDAGTYRCTATNSAGTSEEYIQVIVTPTLPGGPYPPVDRPQPPRPRPPPTPPAAGRPQISRVPVGSNYEFKCLVEDRGSVDFRDVETTFRRADDRPMPATHRVQDSVLYLYDIAREDGGEYACIGTDRVTGQILFTIYADIRVVGPPRIVLEPERQVVRPGDTVSLLCRATGDQPITITWAKERSRMPPSVIINGGEMMFRGINPSDAGQYICKAVNDVGMATAVAEVVVNEDPLITALRPSVRAAEGETVDLRCEVSGYDPSQVVWYRDESSILPLNARPSGNVLTIVNVNVNDQGRYKCEIIRADYSRVSDYIDLTVDRRTTVDIRIEADPLNPRVGETVELTCSTSEGAARVVEWGRSGDADLPPNARRYGDRLQITNLRPTDGGVYTCTVLTPGGAFTENYALVIQNLVSSDIVNYAPNARSVETRSAEFGSTVVMKCQAELEPPASFTWMKQDGQLPGQATVREATLEIPGVHAEDAGTYLCTARNDVRSVDLPIMLIVTGVIPRFLGSSYLGLPTLKDSYLRYDIELSFKPESPDGLILYNSRHDEMSGDYVAFGLQDGYAVYQFDVGAGMLSLTSEAPLTIGEWHSVKLSRNRKNGRMSVDGAASVTGTTEGRHVGLELLTPLYVGGVPDGFTLNGQANYTRGFTGCVARLVVKDSIVELMRVAQEKVNIEHCNTCGDSPCNNGGICQEAYTETGYKCLCSAGYTGASCDETGDTCYPGLCGSGRCVNRPGGYDCFCPFGKTGLHCEHDIVITEPAFADGSYIAYQTPSAIKRFSVGLKVKPTEELRDGLLMYCAQSEQGVGDFTSLAMRNKKLEFRFNTGTGTATLVSDKELVPGEWVKIHANRTDRMGSLRVDDGDMVHGESPGAHKGLNLRIPLYVGGVDTSKIEVASEVEVTDGFSGCISQINVNEREMSIADMSSSLVDSANIGQCEGAADPFGACSLHDPCTNGGVCHDDVHESYRCVCPLGFTGRHCERETPVEESASFSGQSWVEFGRELIMRDRNERSVTLEFTTSKPDGLLLWHGQGPSVSGKGLDFFSIAIEDGFAELKYRTRDGAGSVKSSVRVDDAVRHSLRATLGDQLATLQLDNLPVETVSLPSNAPVNARGGVFIGGVPDADVMTGGMYSVGLDGCLHGVVLGKTRVDTISESALSGVDVVACSS